MSITTLALYESLLKHDRPIAWWGLDTADPLVDDSGHGYTLTAVGAPANATTLLTRGDGGASGCRDFDGAADAYYVLGTRTVAAPAAPAFHGASLADNGSALTTISVVSPSGVKAGDLMLFSMIHDDAARTVTVAPTGWTEVGTTLGTGHNSIATYKLLPAADLPATEYTWTWSGSSRMLGVMLVYRGADPSVSGLVYDSGRQVTSSGDYHSSTTETHPDQARVVVFWPDDDTNIHIVPDPPGVSVRAEVLSGVPNFRMLGVDYAVESAGSIAKTATTNQATTFSVTLVTFGSAEVVDEDVLDTIAETITLHAIIQPDTVAAGTRTILRKRGAYGLQLNGATVEFLYTDGAAVDKTITGPTISASVTTHLVVVDDGTDIHFYADGVETTAARTGTAGYTTNTNRLVIGANHTGAAYEKFFNGKLDEVVVWNAPLSAQMAATYWQAFSAGTFGTAMGDGNSRLPRIKLEMAFASAPTDECQVYEDLTSYMRGSARIATRRGRNFELDRMETGRLDFALDSNEREFDPDYASSPFYPNVKPTRATRFRAQATTDGVVYSRFFGYSEGWPIRRSQAGLDQLAVFTIAGVFKALALDKVSVPTARPAEYAGTRLDALLGQIPNLQTSLDAGQSLISAGDLNGVNRLEHAQAVVETDGGVFFEDGAGVLTFQDRHYRSQNERTVRATYGDGGGTEIPLEHQEPELDEARLFTAARISGADGTVSAVTDDAAALEHFTRTKELATLHESANDAQAMAEAFALRYATPRTRIPGVRIRPLTLANWATVLGHEISHRIATVERVGGDGSANSREHFIEGISDTIAPMNWSVDFSVSPADLDGDFWLLGTGELGDTSGLTSTRLGW
jgi:hypothetical protein